MELDNATPYQAAYTLGVDKKGREHVVVIVKGTFNLPLNGTVATVANNQIEPLEADEFTGEPGFSAVLRESDYALRKPMCDVLVEGSAYAPNDSGADDVIVGLQVSTIKKVFRVVGERFWTCSDLGISLSRPKPFRRMPITYDLAFGGLDDFSGNIDDRDAYMDNPIGCGFHRHLAHDLVELTPVSRTEETGSPVCRPDGKYKPMSMSPIGRGWPERARFAGTYDQNWLENTFPFLPDDFDDRYYQSAPVDQQCSYLQGGERVRLHNLTPDGQTSFTVPSIQMPVCFFHREGGQTNRDAVLDTMVLMPDSGFLTLTWRTSMALRKNIFELAEVLVGERSRGWWRARNMNKKYYPTLASAFDSDDQDEDDDD